MAAGLLALFHSQPRHSPPLPHPFTVQLREFLRFFEAKRDLFVNEAQATVKDVQEARLYDDVFSKSDVEDILMDVMIAVKERVKKDLETTSSMAALLLQQAFSAAETNSCTLHLDVAKAEDAAALAKMRDFAHAASLEGGAFGAGSPSGAAGSAGGAGGAAGPQVDVFREEHDRLLSENIRLAEEAAALRERYNSMQAQCTGLTQQKSELTSKVEALTVELQALKQGSSAAEASSKAHEAELSALQARVAELHKEAESAKVSGQGQGHARGRCDTCISSSSTQTKTWGDS